MLQQKDTECFPAVLRGLHAAFPWNLPGAYYALGAGRLGTARCGNWSRVGRHMPKLWLNAELRILRKNIIKVCNSSTTLKALLFCLKPSDLEMHHCEGGWVQTLTRWFVGAFGQTAKTTTPR